MYSHPVEFLCIRPNAYSCDVSRQGLCQVGVRNGKDQSKLRNCAGVPTLPSN